MNQAVPQTEFTQAPQLATPPDQSPGQKPGTTGMLQWLLSVVVIASFVMTFIVQAFIIPSSSMEDTLLVGDYLLVDKVKYSNGGFWWFMEPYQKINRGDIIVFHYPVRPAQHFVKRVIGLPGDRVRISNKKVFLNGQPLTEPYVVHKRADHDFFRDDFPTSKYISGNVDSRWWIQMRKLTDNGQLIVPEDNYFVLGDNRDDSLDSRYWGFVPAENIVGRPLLIYWSMTQEESRDEDNGSADAKLERIGNVFTRFFRDTRWKRAITIVR